MTWHNSNDLNTQVARLAAHNTTSGDIRVKNQGTLEINEVASTLDPISAQGVHNEALDGDVVLTTHSDLKLISNKLE